MIPLLAGFSLVACGAGARAATIGPGNVTAELGPTFFVDDAVNGGGDATVNQPGVASYNRSFAGLLTAGQGPCRLTFTGFGFAAHTDPLVNDASSLAVTITYLGGDEAVGGGDDVVIGTATGSYLFGGGGEYAFAFDSPLTAELVITGVRFRIQVAPSNGAGTGSVRFKTGSLPYEATPGPRFSVAGFVAAPRVNLAKFQPVTTSTVNGQRLASYVTDGVAGNDNRWQSSGAGPHWARVNFPFPVAAGSAQVFTGIDGSGAQANFRIQYLDGASWVDAPGAVVNGNSGVERNILFSSPVTASSFRVHSSDGSLTIREFALYPPDGITGFPLGTDIGLNLARQRPVVANANTPGNFALLAVDGRVNRASMWQTSAAGTNSLEIDLIASSKIGSAHLYSGSPSVAPLPDFVLKYWDGTAWQEIPGATVAGNSSADLALTFTTPVTTTRVRLEFINPGTTSVRELCLFAANTGNTGYPLGTGVTGAPPSPAKADDYGDSFYQITNPAAGLFIAVGGGGQPALGQAGLTTPQGQYQILLNLSTGTYRLRNRATGNCLSGALLSESPGEPLADAPYAALPHQDWILDPLDGGSFQLINQWSGLALDLQGGGTAGGTPLVQNIANGSVSQRWQAVLSAGFPKKGVGGTNFATVFQAHWAYNWGLTNSSALPPGAVFQPMQWGNFNWTYSTGAASTWKLYPAWRTASQPLHLMGFNEPDAYSQSGNSLDTGNTNEADFSVNRSIDKAVELWPRLEAMDLPLVSPAAAYNIPGGWLESFYNSAEDRGYRVDYTAIHTYPGPGSGSSNGLIGTLQSAYDDWARPVWLTEFSFVDWNGNSSWSEEDCYNCLAEFLWRAESLTYLRKYALFVFTEDAGNPQPANPWQAFTPAPRSNARDLNGNLTAFGKLYAAWDNDAAVRTGKTYFIHHNDSRKRIANLTTQSNLAGRNIRTDGGLVRWTLASAGAANRYHIVSELDGRRISTDGTVVSLAAAGTTGTAVEWSLTESQHGWYYLGHPATSKRLKLVYNNSNSVATYSMAVNTTSDDTVQWRFIVPPRPPVWSGIADNSWTTASSWTPGITPAPGDGVSFDESSALNLATMLDANFSVDGIAVGSPAGPVSIGGTQDLTLGSAGIDLSAATRDLTITAPVILGAAQAWNVAEGRTLSVQGGLTGAFALSIAGPGTATLGGTADPLLPLTVLSGSTLKTATSGVLASGPGAIHPALLGTLDLAGTSQSVNFLSGSGTIDNSAPGAASLTLGNNNSGGTLNTLLQSTGGPLTLVKTGTTSLTLPLANTHSGGFTNHGSGSISPQNNAAFGSGPVVMNGSTIYATAANYTFTNSLTLNGAILRVGGANSRTLVWSGPVTASGNAGISADGSTTGVTLEGALDIAGATFTSTTNGNTNTLSGPVTGAGGNLVASGNNGTLVMAGTASYGGTTTIHDNSFIRLAASGTLPESGSIEINGGLTIRNTVGWVHSGTITGDGTGVINLNTGTNATLAGPISGMTSINANNTGTDATVSGIISGSASVNVQSQGGILRLLGNNSYSGPTTVASPGTLVVNGNQSAATGAIAVNGGTLAGSGTLGGTVTVAAAGSLAPGNPAGTLTIGGGLNLSAQVNGGSGKLRFDLGPVAASDRLAVAGTLTIGSAFLGFSDFVFTGLGGLENGTYPLITSSGISGTLSSVPANLAGPLGGSANGRLRITGSTLELVVTGLGGADPYTTWSGGASFDHDANADGIDNGLAFLLGAAAPTVDATGLLPAATRSGDNLVLTFDCLATEDRGNASFDLQHASDPGLAINWVSSPVPGQPGTTTATAGDVQFVVTDPAPPGGLLHVVATVQAGQPATGRLFARLRASFP